ncbi:unnamed protein product [Citrullus colocynthis]|uniref:Uncharacterized protein n=1 Tax=Citrullus colocynthis TaxID=252529 RepID=A0ABP0YS33_9ROSI
MYDTITRHQHSKLDGSSLLISLVEAVEDLILDMGHERTRAHYDEKSGPQKAQDSGGPKSPIYMNSPLVLRSS